MRVLIDYRPALRERSGTGEYTHQLVRALTSASAGLDDRLAVTLFSSSWKDRLVDLSDLRPASVVDRRIPVRLLNLSWHRLGWPPAEVIAGGTFDVTHSSHPLMLPSRNAAHVVTIHDLNFLKHPERTRAEIRRDYPALARDHAQRADGILVSSAFTATEVEVVLAVPRDRITICPHGAPEWTPRDRQPQAGYILFVGTLEPRKNVGGLLDAYERLITTAGVPDLVLAGKALPESHGWLARIARQPLSGHVRHIGYVEPSQMRQLYEGARLLVLPSFEEGFGIPALEAMTIGVPVVASRRGSLPEVLGDAGVLVDPDRPADIADAMCRVLTDEAFAASCAKRGVERARAFRWDSTARTVYGAYQRAMEQHAHRH
ncbi:MAG TPA: glycosyltransferase family 1 protein [Vicinamibacterales bacterium]